MPFGGDPDPLSSSAACLTGWVRRYIVSVRNPSDSQGRRVTAVRILPKHETADATERLMAKPRVPCELARAEDSGNLASDDLEYPLNVSLGGGQDGNH